MNVVQCTGCAARFNAAKLQPGARFKCPKCGTVNTAPVGEAQPSVAAPQAKHEPPSAKSPTARKAPGLASKTHGKSGPGRTGAARAGSLRRGEHRAAPAAGEGSGMKKYLFIAAGVAVLCIAAFLLLGQNGDNPVGPTDGGGGTGESGGAGDTTLTPVMRGLKERRDKVRPGDYESLLDSVIPYEEANGLRNEMEGDLLAILRAKPEHTRARAKALDLYVARKRTLAPKDAKQQVELAGWCRDMTLLHEMKRELREVLTLVDPQNEGALAMLGREKLGDKWEEPEYVKKMKSVEEQRAAARAEGEKLTERDKIVRDTITAFQGRFGREKFECKDSPPYLLFAEKATGRSATFALEEYEEVAKHLYKLFMQIYDKICGLEGLAQQVLPVYIFENRERYVELGGGPMYAGGHFEPWTGYVFIPYTEGSKYQVIFHECTHQFVQAATVFKGKTQSNQWWFTEGIATYFESFKRSPDGSSFELGIIGSDNRYLDGTSGAKKIIRNNAYEKFDRFFNMDYAAALRESGKKGGDYMLCMYSQSWSIVYFFHHFDGGKYKAKFEEYTKREMHGQGGYEAAKEMFGDLANLENEWKAFVLTLTE
ncbi:MAG: DUF1570 domain-containing protein [Planctomycetota bacterium]|nr:DUF1570 domain-containing protein [Planctomycetota bacterium]